MPQAPKKFFQRFAPSRKLLHNSPVDAPDVSTHNARNLRTASQPKFLRKVSNDANLLARRWAKCYNW